MAGKPKAESNPKPPARKMTPEEQSELFIKTARKLGVDETGEQFERVFAKIAHSSSREVTTENEPKRRSDKRSKPQA